MNSQNNRVKAGLYPLINAGDSIGRLAAIDDAAHEDFAKSQLQVGKAKVRTGIKNEPYLDEIPELLRDPAKSRNVNIFGSDPSGIAAEQFRLMQRRLSNLRPAGTSVLLTSPGAGEGKTLNASNLAWAFAEAGHTTLLLDLDLRRPSQASSIGVSPPRTIDEVLASQLIPDDAVYRIAPTQLFFMGLTMAADDPGSLIRSPNLQPLMSWARRRFKWIIVDGPPILPVADVEELLPIVDLVLLVARERVTPIASLQRAAERLGKRANFVIYNDVGVSDAYGYGYKYE